MKGDLASCYTEYPPHESGLGRQITTGPLERDSLLNFSDISDSESAVYEFFVLRYMTDLIKGDFINLGVVMFRRKGGRESRRTTFADVRFRRNWAQLKAVDPEADLRMLRALEYEIRLHFSKPDERDTLIDTFQDSFSNSIQISEVKECTGEFPEKQLDVLAEIYLGDQSN